MARTIVTDEWLVTYANYHAVGIVHRLRENGRSGCGQHLDHAVHVTNADSVARMVRTGSARRCWRRGCYA